MTTIIVSGPVANKPGNGGVVWNELSYILGFQRLGFDVHLWEEIGRGSCVSADGKPAAFEDSVNLAYFRLVTERFGIASNSALIYDGGCIVHGASLGDLYAVADEAALLVNINGHLRHEGLRSRIRRAVYVDEDPGYTQFWHSEGRLRDLTRHDRFYSVGANIGSPGCTIPCSGLDWRPLRQPVVLTEWPIVGDQIRSDFTTVGSWRGAYGAIEFQGRRFGLKAHEFRRFSSLPVASGRRFEVALDIHPDDDRDRQMLLENGWLLIDPRTVTADPDAFREYVQSSSAEFSVAQGIYADTNSGWFSDRSARYLASGKPVLVQDTGLNPSLPVGEGLLTFSTLAEAVEGAEAIARNYRSHAEAARAIAERSFDSDKVLAALLDDLGVTP